jgi:hypothetical protein
VSEQLYQRFQELDTPESPFANLPEARVGRWGENLIGAKMNKLPVAEAGPGNVDQSVLGSGASCETTVGSCMNHTHPLARKFTTLTFEAAHRSANLFAH